MDKPIKNECRCEKTACGCAGGSVERCTCGERCACKTTCQCSGGCQCMAAK